MTGTFLLRISIALAIACGLFYFCPTTYLFTGLMCFGLYFALVASRWGIVLLTALAIGFLGVIVFLSDAVGFFGQVLHLMLPAGLNASWRLALPQFFIAVLPCAVIIMILALALVGSIYRGWADFWLAQTFTSYLTYIFLVFSLLNCFCVGITLYTALSTNVYTLFIWELVFQWIPFFACSFLLYYYLGYIFDPTPKQKISSKEARKHYMQQKRKRRPL
jgi:hypothetical protein